ncbi:MAG: L-histidine N(alpha)-methyltransferase [Novosphingobium sp. 17-62-19]|uniref:L-histidine N(alpha)-methyltransferase n=1 Tax=Novosphingobium sp. 17-62-19 TaxID=1970406 RepID=UPI000BD1CB56|nr:L-histidine N(alpha)-methyltransferase [Novosphingobium sp. 17-62-19]OZA21578.1 MAG: L-histidine N(alpha)-methyltransferase [Novosphingobium sp. 17-62-19]OZA69557.1 MAG: L-histidine N(alpha)-methyltransferase [Sphingomonadales bacterium 39-62-4]HQS95283.1 L-histidine N(alpha)-methyltransferase [Novosphingobium sp.]
MHFSESTAMERDDVQTERATEDSTPGTGEFLREVLDGLSHSHRAIPCRFLYDAAGSAIFDRICDLPEYYPTRTERRILETNAHAIAAATSEEFRFVELGAGSGGKAEILLDAMQQARAYVCIDISPVPLASAAAAVRARYPGLAVSAVCGNYLGELDLPPRKGLRDLCFFPGSTIGNFERDDALVFLREWRNRLGPDGMMLIGVDLKKDVAVLEAAYDDRQGVTAAFSLNLLHRANRELGADFDTDAFRHRARYVSDPGHVEISLVSQTEQVVAIAGQTFRFAKGEAIHVENSHKYAIDEFAALAGKAGFDSVDVWTDDDALFSVHLLRVAG